MRTFKKVCNCAADAEVQLLNKTREPEIYNAIVIKLKIICYDGKKRDQK